MVPQVINIIIGPTRAKLITQCFNSWRPLKKFGFTIKIWNDDSIVDFFKKNHPSALQMIANSRNHAEIADLARYAIIYYHGGYYVDWDIELLYPKQFLDLCKKSPKGFLIQDPLNQTLASECFSAVKGEQYLLNLVENIIEIYNGGFRDELSTPYFSGPFRMREVYYYSKLKSAQKVYPVKEIFRYDYEEIRQMPDIRSNAPLIHYWIHSWFF